MVALSNNTAMKKLRISSEIALPIDAVTQRISILGRTGTGKSYTAGVLVEEALKARQQVVIMDPKGDWWGLRASADGKAAGMPITIMGGEHGDVPLDPNAGTLVADIIISEGISVVLDLSLFESKAEEIRFATAFLDRLYRKNRKPVLFVCDEADVFAPQKPEKNETTMLNRMETVCRRGRSKGIGVVLVSQRSAALHKGCLSQTELMIAHQTTAPQDKKAIEYWVVAHGDEEQHEFFMGNVTKLAKGHAIAWSPSWLNIFKAIKVRVKETYDSSQTPRVGVRRRAPKVLAQVDIERLKKHMADTIEKMKQDDPKLLRIEISKLQAALKGSQKVTVQPPKIDPIALKLEMEKWKKSVHVAVTAPKPVAKKIILDRDITRLRRALEQLEKLRVKVNQAVGKIDFPHHDIMVKLGQVIDLNEEKPDYISQTLRKLKANDGEITGRDTSKIPVNQFQLLKNRPTPTIKLSQIPAGTADYSDGGIKQQVVDGERRILVALENFKGRPVTKSQLAVLCGIKANGTTMATYISRLKRRGYIVQVGDSFYITLEGAEFSGVSEEMTPDKVQSMWLNRFHSGPRDILSRLIELYPESANMNVIAGELKLKEDGTTLATYISRLRAAGLITVSKEAGGKLLKASKDLFEVTA